MRIINFETKNMKYLILFNYLDFIVSTLIKKLIISFLFYLCTIIDSKLLNMMDKMKYDSNLRTQFIYGKYITLLFALLICFDIISIKIVNF